MTSFGDYFKPKNFLNAFWWHTHTSLSYNLFKALTKKKDQSPAESRYNGIEVQKSVYGDPVPLIYGQQRLAWTLGWYGNFKSIPSSNSGGGKGGGGGGGAQTSFTYSASLLGFICEGPITSIGNVWADKQVTTLSALGLTLFYGTGGQTTWSFLTTNFPAQAIPYDHTAYIASGAFDLKDSPGLPNLSFEINGLQQYGLSGIYDAEPSSILTDYCTDPNHGCNFNSLGSLTNYMNYCKAMGFFISPIETSQRPAMDFIKELLRTTNSEAFTSAGVLNIVPLADAAVTGNGATYTPNMTPLFTFGDDDFIYAEGDEDPVQVTRKAQSDMRNVVRIEYLNRANNYNTAIMEASDAQDITLNGMRVAQTVSLHMITTGAVARAVAQIMLQRNLYFRSGYQFKVRADYCLLEPMDIVALNDAALGLNNQLVRIVEVEDSEDDEITISAEELPLGPAGVPIYNFQAEQGYYANYAAAPGSVQAPYIFTAPSLLIDAGGGYEVWIAVGGPSGSGNWGGCRVLMSMDNVRYQNIGTIYSPARYGTLTASLASSADPDSTNTLSVQLNNTTSTMASATTADADNMRTLIYVDGEIMSYGTATLTGPGAYNLTYLRRGKYGSAIASHASSTRFIRLDGSIFKMPFDPGMLGQTMYFKFQSFNIFGGGLEDTASLTAYTYVVANAQSLMTTSNGLTLIPRGSCAVVGNSIFKTDGGSAAWDSDCYSLQSFSNGCAVSFSANQLTKEVMVGLNTDPLTDNSYTSIDYAWHPDSSGALSIYESGALIGTFGSYTTDTVLRIEYDGQRVQYFKDGVLMRSVDDRGKTFFLDSSFYSPGGSVRNVAFGPLTAAPSIPFIARGSCIATANTAAKLDNGTAAYDSDVYSRMAYANGCYVSAQAAQTNKEITVGLNTDPTTDSSYTSVDYGWIFLAAGTPAIYESGSFIASFSAYTTATVLSIKYDGQRVQYFLDGALVRSVDDRGKTFYMDSAFYQPGGKLFNLEFGPLTTAESAPFTARGNCVCTTNTARRSGGGPAWDSDVYSNAGYQSGCQVSFQSDSTVHSLMVGLNTDPTTDSSFTSIDYAWYCTNASAALQIYESGSLIGTFGTYTTSTALSIKYDGQLVQYFKDGVLIRSLEDRGKTFFMDSSFNDDGASVRNLEFGPLTTAPSIPWIARGNCVATTTTMKKNGGTNAWDSDCYSYEAYSNGCSVTFNPEAGHAMIGLNSDPLTDQNYTSLDFAWEFDVSAGNAWLYIQSTGANPLTISGTLTTSTILSITYDGRFVRFLANGTVVATYYSPDKTFFFDSSFNSVGATARNVSFGPMTAATPAPYITRGNCFVSDSQIKKIGGSNAYDSDCYSINGYTTCHVAFKASATTGLFAIGLNTDPVTDTTDSTIDYAFEFSGGGALYIIENGVIFGGGAIGTYTTTDVLAITYDGSTITYLKNGVSQRTVSVSGLTLFMDSSFYTPGAACNSLVFGPTVSLQIVDTMQMGLNAATDVVTTTVSSYTITHLSHVPDGFSFNDTIASISYTPGVDVTAVLSVTCSVTMTMGTLTPEEFYGRIADSSSFASATGISVFSNNITTGNSIKMSFSYNTTFALSAGVAKTFIFIGKQFNNGTVVLDNIKFKLESIKR